MNTQALRSSINRKERRDHKEAGGKEFRPLSSLCSLRLIPNARVAQLPERDDSNVGDEGESPSVGTIHKGQGLGAGGKGLAQY